MTPTAQYVFDATASTYDRQRALLIPGFERLYGAVTDLLPATLQTCVDLGAGTGLLAAHVAEARPGTTLHLIDTSEPMLAQARVRLAAVPYVHFICADYNSAPLPRPVDAVVSALSIHHLTDQAKRDLFGSIATSLRLGGVFINADQVLGPTLQLAAEYREDWLRRVRALGASEEQIAESLFRQQADRCAPVEDQLGWMQEHFVDVDCWYKDGCFAVMVGRRASGFPRRRPDGPRRLDPQRHVGARPRALRRYLEPLQFRPDDRAA